METSKAKVAMEAIKERKSLAELAKRYEVSPNQVSLWKQESIQKMGSLFGKEENGGKEDKEVEIKSLQRKVGKLVIDRDFLFPPR